MWVNNAAVGISSWALVCLYCSAVVVICVAAVTFLGRCMWGLSVGTVDQWNSVKQSSMFCCYVTVVMMGVLIKPPQSCKAWWGMCKTFPRVPETSQWFYTCPASVCQTENLNTVCKAHKNTWSVFRIANHLQTQNYFQQRPLSAIRDPGTHSMCF